MTQTPSRNRAPAASAARGDETREALLAAAMDIFGRDGFHGASTRAIASAAGANQALIGYHFGGKQGLYLAVYESIVEQIRTSVLPMVGEIVQQLDSMDPQSTDSHELALQCLENLASVMLAQFASEPATSWPRLVVREQQDPTEAFELLWEGMYVPMLSLIGRLLGLLLELDPESETVRARSLMFLGQIIVFLAARSTAVRHMNWETVGPAEMERVRVHFLQMLREQFAAGMSS